MMEQVDLVISNAPRGGWMVRNSGETIAAFSTISELCAWLEKEYRQPDETELPPSLPRFVDQSNDANNVTLLQQIGSHITGKR